MKEEKWKTDIGIVCPSCGKHVQQPYVTGGEVDGSVLFKEDGAFEEDILPYGYTLSCPFCYMVLLENASYGDLSKIADCINTGIKDDIDDRYSEFLVALRDTDEF